MKDWCGRLALHEEVLLLALQDRKGTVVMGAHWGFAVGGALLAELLLQRRLLVDGSGRKPMIEVAEPASTGDEILDETLGRVATAKRRGSVATWVQRLSGTKRLRQRVAMRLVERGILRADEDRVLLLFTRKVYPERDHEPEREIIARLRDAVFTPTSEIGPRTVVLLALTYHTGLLRAVLDRKELKAGKKRIEEIIEGNVLGDATKEVVRALQAAMIAVSVATR